MWKSCPLVENTCCYIETIRLRVLGENKTTKILCIVSPNPTDCKIFTSKSFRKATVLHLGPWSLGTGSWRMPEVLSWRNTEGRFSPERKWDESLGENKHFALQGGLRFLPCPGPLLPWPLRSTMHLSWSTDQGGQVTFDTKRQRSSCLIISLGKRRGPTLLACPFKQAAVVSCGF